MQVIDLIKLDLGCGLKKKEGFLGLDKMASVKPDIIADLDRDGIPLKDDTVGEIEAVAILEHCHNTIFILNEMHRVCISGAKIHIAVPHWSCDDQYKDPTHVKLFTEDSASYWDRRGAHYTQGADYGVKSMFSKIEVMIEIDPYLNNMTEQERQVALRFFRNAKQRIHFNLIVEKHYV